MFDRISNVFLFSCLLCLLLPLFTGCNNKIGDDWTKITTGMKTDSATGVTTAVVGGLDTGKEYEFRLTVADKPDHHGALGVIMVDTKAKEAGNVDEIEFKVAGKTDHSVTLAWNDNVVVNARTKEAGGTDEIKLKVANKTDNSVTLTWDKDVIIDAKTQKNTDIEKVEFKLAKKADNSVTLTWNNNKAWIFKLEGRKSPKPGPQIPEVIVDSVNQDDAPIYIYTEGRTVPYNSVEIRTRVSGYLEELFFKPGAIVKEGDRLAQIEQATYKIALLAAKAELANSEARASLAKSNLERQKMLLDRGAGTAEDLQTQQANYDMTLAAIELANASIKNAELNLQYTDLRSPITGKTTKNLVDIGNYVSPTGAQAVLLSITQLDPMYVEFKLSDRQVSDLKDRLGFREVFNKAVNTPGEIQHDNFSEQPLALTGMNVDVSLMTGVNVFNFDFNIPGKIVALVDDRINFASGQITLRAEIKNPLLKTNEAEDYLIYAGQACRVRVPYEIVKDAVLVREEAILTDLDTKYVLVVAKGMYQPKASDGSPLVDENGDVVPPYEADIVQRRDIEIGRLLDTQMRIVLDHPLKPGVKPGESYIVQGVQRVRIGMEVKPTTLTDYETRRAAERNGH